ncbi:MAG: hypothetical protein QNJ40_16005 [Xanthomonadales bacterium]|nr:hypothetical protein [Xanthomonadales bacterium]
MAVHQHRWMSWLMATAEQLLHQARYAVSSISFGTSRRNRRNASRARSLCRKIIRRYPGSTQAGEAATILRQLGEVNASPGIAAPPRTVSREAQHGKKARQLENSVAGSAAGDDQKVNWGELLGLIFKLPKGVLAALVAIGVLLFFIFGPFLLVVLIVIAVITLNGSSRKKMKPKQRQEINALIARLKTHVEKQAAQK